MDKGNVAMVVEKLISAGAKVDAVYGEGLGPSNGFRGSHEEVTRHG